MSNMKYIGMQTVKAFMKKTTAEFEDGQAAMRREIDERFNDLVSGLDRIEGRSSTSSCATPASQSSPSISISNPFPSIQIFETAEGMLSNEQGVYVAEIVAAKNTKQAKGRFRAYDSNDEDNITSNHSAKKEPAREVNVVGKKDSGKLAKKPDKGKTAKEEACGLLLKEESLVWEKVKIIQKDLSSVLKALGEIAVANPVFTHSQLPSLIIEWILSSPKKTGLHDSLLGIINLHMDPILTLPRLRMISALYHVLGVVPAYQASIGPALNELCLGLQSNEVGSALNGVYAKDVHVRMACLNAIKCIPAVTSRSLTQSVEVGTSIWIALHDPEKSVAELAEDIWDRYGYEFGTDYSELFNTLSHVNFNVRLAAAEALAAALDEHPDTIQESL